MSVTPRSQNRDDSLADILFSHPSSRPVCPPILQELLPLVLSFELPAIVQSDPSSPTVQHISQTYNLTVSFKPLTRLYRATGVVRGSQNNASAVKVRMGNIGMISAFCCNVSIMKSKISRFFQSENGGIGIRKHCVYAQIQYYIHGTLMLPNELHQLYLTLDKKYVLPCSKGKKSAAMATTVSATTV